MPKPLEMRDRIMFEQEALKVGDIGLLGLPEGLNDGKLLDGYAPSLALTALEYALSELVLGVIRRGIVPKFPENSYVLSAILAQRNCDPTCGTGLNSNQVLDFYREFEKLNRDHFCVSSPQAA